MAKNFQTCKLYSRTLGINLTKYSTVNKLKELQTPFNKTEAALCISKASI